MALIAVRALMAKTILFTIVLIKYLIINLVLKRYISS